MIAFTVGLLVGSILTLLAVSVGIVYQVVFKVARLDRKEPS